MTVVLGRGTCAQDKTPDADTPDRAQIAKLTEQLKQSPRDVDALVARGRAYHAVGDFEKESSDLEAATRLAPQRSDIWQAYGEAFLARNHSQEAIDAFDRAIALKPKEPLVFVERAMAYKALGNHEQTVANLTSAIEIKPTYVDAYVLRGQMWRELGSWGKCFADYGRAIEIEPKNLTLRVVRASALLSHHEYENAFEDVKAAMRLSPGDLGVNYQPVSDKKLSPEALAHGAEQVRKMLKDRPAMAEHVCKDDKIWTWAARKFAGEDLGAPIDWDPASPAPFSGCSVPPTTIRHAAIRVGLTRNGLPNNPPQTFDQLWAVAVFELHNVTSSTEWRDICEQLTQNKLARNEYILAMLNSEERAAQRTRAFYMMYFFPWLQSKNLKDTDPIEWQVNEFFTTGDRHADLAVWGEDSRIALYGAWYDLASAAREYDRGNFAKVKAILEPHLAANDSLSNQKLNEVHYWLGYADLGLGDTDAAIKEFTAALDSVPDDAETFRARGAAKTKLLQFDQALDDFNNALRLDPKLGDAYHSRAYEYIRRGNFDAAASDAQAAIELDPHDSKSFSLRGDVSLGKNDLSHALADYEKAVQLSSDNYRGYLGRACVWEQKGELTKSLADFDVALRLNPKDDYAFAHRGIIHFIDKRYRQALADSTAAIDLNPDNFVAHQVRAEVLLQTDDKQIRNSTLALQDAKKACELEKWKQPESIALLASAYAANEDYDNAVQSQTKALSSVTDPKARSEYTKTLEDYKTQASKNKKSRSKDAPKKSAS